MLRGLGQRVGRWGGPGPAAAAAAGGAQAGRLFGSSSSGSGAADQSHDREDLYGVLECAPSATQAELKAAFRRKARVLHPDASPAAGGRPDRAAFVQLLAAYQVLSNPRARQLYDLSRDRAGPSVLRAAAAGGVAGAAGAAYEEAEVDLSWGLSSLFKQPPGGGAQGALDHMRQELQGELHSAVRRAYLGPRIEALGAGSLPDAFEADERSTPGCPDLLQLVSGRQLLGAVRERRLQALGRQAAAAAALHSGEAGSAAAEAAAAAALPEGAGQQQAAGGQEGAGERLQGPPPPGLHAAEAPQQRQQQHAGCTQTRPQRAQQQQAQQQQQRQQPEPDILDLIVGEAVVASAVRHRQPPDGARGTSSHGGGGGDGGVAAPAPAEVMRVYGRDGELLAQVEAPQLDPGSATAASSRLLDARGRHTHTVFHTQTPLVRHLTVTAEQAGTGVRSARPSRLVVCRARRAWLPPSSLWLFKPLDWEHDIGGWCIEWAGEEQRGHPAWLPPAVLVLTAAFASLDHERAARQPLGLFNRLRAAAATTRSRPAEEGRGGGGGSTAAAEGWRAWLGSWKRFHGVR